MAENSQILSKFRCKNLNSALQDTVMPKEMTLQIKGAMHPNADGSNRLFEIAMLDPGSKLELVPEPSNPFDPGAIAIYTENGQQIGYVSAERCGLIGVQLRAGRILKAVFQSQAASGGYLRVNFEGRVPTLPSAGSLEPAKHTEDHIEDDHGFYPDYIPPDDF